MSQSPPSPPPEDLEWEEWDSRTSPLSFPHHCLAGSFAGVAEHTLLYPLDTVKTCWQSQVLHKATNITSSAASSSSGCVGSGSCGIFTMETLKKIIMPGSVGGNGTAYAGGDNGNNGANKSFQSTTTSQLRNNSINPISSSSKTQQGIWSTMKHLMQQGHHHSHYQPTNQTLFTLAGNPPNVVDLTTAINNANAASFDHTNSISSSSSSTNKPIIVKRPWSKHGRILRNATLQDITAQGMIRASSSSVGDVIMLHNPSSGHVTSSNAIASNHAGVRRLWRGVQSMFVGCIPAHALYFSSYELIKSVCTDGGGGYQHHHPPHQQQQQQQQLYSSPHDSMAQEKKEQRQDQDQGHVGHDTLSPTQAMLAGGVATLLHDFVMTPMDTMKQRMQLGHYDNLRHAFVSIVWGGGAVGGGDGVGSRGYGALSGGEGWKGLYRSFPITVMTNVPYGMIMMTTNEWLRGVLEDGLYGIHGEEEKETNPFHFTTIMLSGMGAGAVASAVTAPLDRVKTRLQTQRMGMVLPSHYTISGAPASSPTTMTTRGKLTGHAGNTTASVAIIMEERALAAAQGNPKVCPKMAVQDVTSTLFPSSAVTSPIHTPPPRPVQSFMATTMTTPFQTYYSTPFEAFQSIVQEEGLRGLFRGTLPRVALHAPSVAISWTAYEMAKDWLIWSQQ